MKRLSAIIIEIAETALVRPVHRVSEEGAHAALLLAHVAWNREVEPQSAPTTDDYEKLMREFARHNRRFASDLKSPDYETLIEEMRMYKRQHYPSDQRIVTVCGTTPQGNVRVEWR